MSNYRTYGRPPFGVVLVHGGPGGGGEMAPVAIELSQQRGVIEAFQTKASVEGQTSELKDIIESVAGPPVALLGWSWGAWLAYLTAARFPHLVRKLFLISSGPFDERYARRILTTRLSRLGENESARVQALLKSLSETGEDPAALQELGALFERADSYEAVPDSALEISVRQDIYQSVWPEAAELRRNGELLNMGESIACPVVAIHGDYDPHPAEGVERPLAQAIKDFRFVLLERCGHAPWRETHARNAFYAAVEAELSG